MEKQFSRNAPSPRYVEFLGLYKEMHDDGQEQEGIPADQMFAGHSLVPLVRVIKQVVDRFTPRTLLDYGAGKGMVYRGPVNIEGRAYASIAEFWGVDDITCYDPGYEPFSVLPGEKFDGVICTDVLEHIPEEDLPWILGELPRFRGSSCSATSPIIPPRNISPTARTPIARSVRARGGPS